jgi:uncharacterized membrane protein YidH (DUF202 family)
MPHAQTLAAATYVRRLRSLARNVPVIGGAVGVVLLALGIALPFNPIVVLPSFALEWRSVAGLLFGFQHIRSWLELELFALPILAGVGTVLAAAPATRRAGAGVLAAVGLAAYAAGFARFGHFLRADSAESRPLAAMLLLLAGASVTAASGYLLWTQTARAGPAALTRRLPRLLTVLGSVLVVLGAVVPYLHSGGSFALLYAPAGATYDYAPGWPLLVPAATVALALLLSLRACDGTLAAAALGALGTLTALFFIGLIGAAATGAALGAGGPLGLAGAAVLVAAAATIVLAHPAATAEEADDTAPAESQELTRSEATRYLCAAAHLDDRFSREVIRRVVDEEHRAVAPSFGVNLGVVLRHCLGARRRKQVRDVLLAMLVVPIVLLLAYRHTTAGVVAVLALGAAAWVVVFAERWISAYRVGARQLSRSTYDPKRVPELSAADERKVRKVEQAEQGNVVVYSGYRPFVGSGWDHGGWSFALNVAKGKRALGNGARLTPLDFAVDELYDAVAADLETLALPGLTVEDRLYVDGEGIRDDKRFVSDRLARPSSQIPAEALRDLLRSPELTNRVYRCIRIRGWAGEYVLSVFLNFTSSGRSLFAEARYFLLAPVRNEHLAIDKLEPWPPLGQKLRIAASALVVTPFLLAAGVLRTLNEVRSAVRRWRAGRTTRRLIRTDPNFDYGATTSVRELAQSDTYRRYFQQLDREMTGKIVERQILDSIIRFLDERNIDTSEIEERQTAILNNGLIVSGGTLNAESLAVGTRARATVERLRPRHGGKPERMPAKAAATTGTKGGQE